MIIIVIAVVNSVAEVLTRAAHPLMSTGEKKPQLGLLKSHVWIGVACGASSEIMLPATIAVSLEERIPDFGIGSAVGEQFSLVSFNLTNPHFAVIFYLSRIKVRKCRALLRDWVVGRRAIPGSTA